MVETSIRLTADIESCKRIVGEIQKSKKRAPAPRTENSAAAFERSRKVEGIGLGEIPEGWSGAG